MTTESALRYWIIEDDIDMQYLVQMKLGVDVRARFCGAATNSIDALELLSGIENGVVVLDHFIEGQIMGLQLAPLIKAVAPSARIILFTSHDLAFEVSREPAIDAYLRKNDLAKLLPTALRLMGLGPVGK